jgi:hypothetical protein
VNYQEISDAIAIHISQTSHEETRPTDSEASRVIRRQLRQGNVPSKAPRSAKDDVRDLSGITATKRQTTDGNVTQTISIYITNP